MFVFNIIEHIHYIMVTSKDYFSNKILLNHLVIVLPIAYLTLLQAAFGEPRFKGLITNCSMFELDRRINNMLLHPDMSKRDELYQSVFTIHLQMLHVHEVTLWNLNDTEAQDLGRQLVQRNGLLIFNTPVTEKLFRETFKCDSATTYEIYDLLKNCVRLYNSSEPLIREMMCEKEF